MSTGFLVAAAVVAAALVWLYARRRRPVPCPAAASFLLENGFMERRAGSGLLLDRAGVAEGMRVLDVGCGPGRLSLPAAERVGPDGLVVALDIQEAMLKKLRARAAEQGIVNIRIVHAGIGEGKIERGFFDRALMVTVLGEVRDRERALQEVFAALKPGGILSITEVLPDPDYQPREKVRRLAEAAGFKQAGSFGTLFAFTANFVRPATSWRAGVSGSGGRISERERSNG